MAFCQLLHLSVVVYIRICRITYLYVVSIPYIYVTYCYNDVVPPFTSAITYPSSEGVHLPSEGVHLPFYTADPLVYPLMFCNRPVTERNGLLGYHHILCSALLSLSYCMILTLSGYPGACPGGVGRERGLNGLGDSKNLFHTDTQKISK